VFGTWPYLHGRGRQLSHTSVSRQGHACAEGMEASGVSPLDTHSLPVSSRLPAGNCGPCRKPRVRPLPSTDLCCMMKKTSLFVPPCSHLLRWGGTEDKEPQAECGPTQHRCAPRWAKGGVSPARHPAGRSRALRLARPALSILPKLAPTRWAKAPGVSRRMHQGTKRREAFQHRAASGRCRCPLEDSSAHLNRVIAVFGTQKNPRVQ
jgi:hypothetical protein